MKVIIHYPQAKDEIEELEARIAWLKAVIIINKIENTSFTCNQKKELIEIISRLNELGECENTDQNSFVNSI